MALIRLLPTAIDLYLTTQGYFPLLRHVERYIFLQTKAIYYIEAILARGTLSRCFSVTVGRA